MPKFRYVAIAPGRIEDRKKLGPASYLHDFLVDHQTDAEGNVNYGKPFGYAWIRARWSEAPPVRSLERHMSRLKAAGKVWVQRLPWGQGMKVRVLNSAKWPSEPRQMPLFPPAEILSINRGKAVRKLSNSPDSIPPLLARSNRHFWRSKEVKNLREEKTYSEPLADARCSAVEDAALDERRRLLREQSRLVQLKYKTSG